MINKMANLIFTSENVSFFSQCGDQTLRPYFAMMFGHMFQPCRWGGCCHLWPDQYMEVGNFIFI